MPEITNIGQKNKYIYRRMHVKEEDNGSRKNPNKANNIWVVEQTTNTYDLTSSLPSPQPIAYRKTVFEKALQSSEKLSLSSLL